MTLPFFNFGWQGVPNQNNQSNASREDKDMNYSKVTKKKDKKMVEAPILKDQMK
jgi:hypothetical protein